MHQDDVQAALAGMLAVAAKMCPADVTRDKRLREDLGINSLSLIDVTVAAEDAFGVMIPDEDLKRFQTVGDVPDHIRRAKVTT